MKSITRRVFGNLANHLGEEGEIRLGG